MDANENEVQGIARVVSQHVVEATHKGASTGLIYESLRQKVAMSPSLSMESNKCSISGLCDGVILCLYDMGKCQIFTPTLDRLLRYYESRDTPRKPIRPQEVLRTDQVSHYFLESALTFIEDMRFDQSWRDAASRLKEHVKIDWPIPNTPFDDDSPYTDFNDDELDRGV